MKSPIFYSGGLAIIFAALTISISLAAVAPGSIGTDIAKITGLNYQGPDQWVEIANQGTGSIDLTGWTLMNQENQTYVFPANTTLKAGSRITVHSLDGSNTPSDLYNSTLLWNEGGDSATLRDADGRIISEYKYPVEVSAAQSAAVNRTISLPDQVSSGGMNPPFLPDYRSPSAGQRSSLSSRPTANLTGHPFICHGGPLNWAWTSGLG